MVLAIGHRGARGYEPENTILSFKKAVKLGVDFVELDVHLSKDNQLIVIHDDTLDRTTNGKGKISEKTLKEIKKYRTKEKKQRIPTLQEAIKAVKGKTKLNIEIKEKGPEEQVIQTIKKNKIERQVMVSSNNVKSLIAVKEKIPEIKTTLVYYSTKTKIGEYLFIIFSLMIFPITKLIILKRAKKAKVDYVSMEYNLVSKKLISRLHKHGHKVLVWTVNNSGVIKKMIIVKVDGIISDYPEKVKKI